MTNIKKVTIILIKFPFIMLYYKFNRKLLERKACVIRKMSLCPDNE